MGRKVGTKSKAHDHEHVWPTVSGKVVHITQKTVRIVTVLVRALQINGLRRIEFSRHSEIRTEVIEGPSDNFVVSISVHITGRHALGVKEVGQLSSTGALLSSGKCGHSLGE